MILAGDIGGTSARIAVFDEHPGGLRLVLEREYASHHYPGLEAVLERFLDEQSLRLRAACFGIAGRVTHGRVVTPNLPWTVEAASIARRLSLKEVRPINDLEANAWAVAELSAPDLVTLSNGDPFGQSGHRAIIAAGTGLGEAALLASDHPIDLTRCQVANCYMGRAGLINSGGPSGANGFGEAVATSVINKRAGGSDLISGRKAFQRPLAQGVKLLNAIQDAYPDSGVTIA
jgi:hypothetical protein